MRQSRFIPMPESGQLILNGVSELSLDHFVDEINNKHGIPANIGQPRVAYRETVSTETGPFTSVQSRRPP